LFSIWLRQPIGEIFNDLPGEAFRQKFYRRVVTYNIKVAYTFELVWIFRVVSQLLGIDLGQSFTVHYFPDAICTDFASHSAHLDTDHPLKVKPGMCVFLFGREPGNKIEPAISVFFCMNDQVGYRRGYGERHVCHFAINSLAYVNPFWV
jgi:hypothetical protein